MSAFLYITPSLIPSNSANSVHVIHQCDALAQLGLRPTIIFKRSTKLISALPSSIFESYGVDVKSWSLCSFYTRFAFADNFIIALLSLKHIFSNVRFDFILSRNLYAAFFLTILRRRFLFETHQLETGFRGFMQKYILLSPFSKTILISNSQVACLQSHHHILLHNYVVLHDAAPSGLQPTSSITRDNFLAELHVSSYLFDSHALLCGYFGQLSAGRGIEIILDVAAIRPNYFFVVFGGNDSQIEYYKNISPQNIFYAGTCSHSFSILYQRCFDVLLMPYQESVSIGVKNHDTAKWMSPMKMFEYMSSGVPIISSDLPVLREVLCHRSNSFLCSPNKSNEWISVLDELSFDCDLATAVATQAYSDYSCLYTWSIRAKSIVAFSA